jgi:hypothetical protein
MQKLTTYFEKPGRHNTNACVEIVRGLVAAGHTYVVVASTSGRTALKFARGLRGTGAQIVSVGLPTGFRRPNFQVLAKSMRAKLEALGVKPCIGVIPTYGIEGALAKGAWGVFPSQIVAETLWRFGQGVKVACEVTWMACDAGLIPEGEEVVGVGGTARGSDAVVVVKSATTFRFLDFKVLEIAAKAN